MEENHDWSGEAGNSKENFVPDSLVRLPVGIVKDGQLYREIVVEQMCGIDDHNIAEKNPGDNGSVATSLVLCRCIQEVPGLLPQKKNPEAMFDRQLARAMTNPDRDYALARIYMMSKRNEAVMAGKCDRCSKVWEEDVLLSNLPVTMWDDDAPREFEVTLETGFRELVGNESVFHKDCVMRFPTGAESELAGKIKSEPAALDALIASCITKAGSLSQVDQEMAKRLTSTDRQEIVLAAQVNLPGLRQWKDVTCSCGGNVEMKLDLTSFLSERRRQMKK